MTPPTTKEPSRPRARTTTITGFHQDADGDWVAELACGHTQHMRHRPPWQERPWVTTEAGRAAKLGAPIDCASCATEEDGSATL
jgi:hypothetical protein